MAEAGASRGDTLLATARGPAALDALVSAHQGRVVAAPLDVTEPETARTVVATAEEKLGRVGVLVNNTRSPTTSPRKSSLHYEET